MSRSYRSGSSRQAALASGVTLDYVEQGDPTALPLVLLPGLSDSWRSFVPVLDELPADVHAVAVSQRGHGASSRPVTGYRPADYARDVVAFLDVLDMECALLVGHSSSTFTARLVAGSHPRRAVGLVLIASPVTLTDNAAAAELQTVLDGLADPVPEEVVRRFVTSTVGTSVSAPFLEAMVVESRKLPARVWRETFRGVLAYDGAADLPRIVAPTLLVWGDADDIVTRPDQDELRAALAHSRRLEYAGVGHSPHWEQPVRFAADVAAFTRELSR